MNLAREILAVAREMMADEGPYDGYDTITDMARSIARAFKMKTRGVRKIIVLEASSAQAALEFKMEGANGRVDLIIDMNGTPGGKLFVEAGAYGGEGRLEHKKYTVVPRGAVKVITRILMHLSKEVF